MNNYLPNKPRTRVVLPIQPRLPSQRGRLSLKPQDWPLWETGLLCLALLMFGQTFQYLIDVYPLYILSKVWPLLMIPFVIIGFRQPDAPYKKLAIATFVWSWGITPFIGTLQLGNAISDALATTVKAWAFMFPFSVFGFLIWMRPNLKTVRFVLMALGVGSFAALTIIWVITPFSVYNEVGLTTKLYMYDDERGYHLFIPLLFGLMTLFAINRAFWIRPRLWHPICVAAIMAVMIIIYKERATLAGALVICAWGALDSVRSRLRSSVFAMATIGAGVLGFVAVLHFQNTDLNHSGLGGSLSIRQNSVASAFNYLSEDPLRWIFGVGSTSRVGDVSLGALVNNKSFYLDDIGWLGVVFEYGVIGGTLIALLHLAALHQTRRAITPNDPVAMALSDYVVYVLLVSPIYSVMFTPGEALTCFGIATYFIHQRKSAK